MKGVTLGRTQSSICGVAFCGLSIVQKRQTDMYIMKDSFRMEMLKLQ